MNNFKEFEKHLSKVLNQEVYRGNKKYIIVRKSAKFDPLLNKIFSFNYYVLEMNINHDFKNVRNKEVNIIIKEEAKAHIYEDNINSFKKCYMYMKSL